MTQPIIPVNRVDKITLHEVVKNLSQTAAIDGVVDNLCDVNSGQIAELKIQKPWLNFADKKYSSEYNAYNNQKGFFLVFIGLFCSFVIVDSVFTIIYNDYEDTIIHKTISYIALCISLVPFLKKLSHQFTIMLRVLFILVLIGQIISIYSEEANNDIKLYFELFVLFFYQFSFYTKDFRFHTITTIIYTIAITPA